MPGVAGVVRYLWIALACVACAADGPASNNTPGPGPGPGPSTDPVASGTVNAEAYGDGYGGVGGFIFAPPTLKLLINGTVSWQNGSGVGHTISIEGNTYDLPAGGNYDRVFSATGTFAYSCTIHPSMTGSVEVVTP